MIQISGRLKWPITQLIMSQIGIPREGENRKREKHDRERGTDVEII